MAPKSQRCVSLLILSQMCLVLTYGSRLPINGQQEGSPISPDLKPLPKAMTVIGSIDGVTYHQQSIRMSYSDAQANCNNNRMSIASFPNKAHLDFVIANGAMDSSWTDGRASYSRSFYTPPVDPIIYIDLSSQLNYALVVNISGGNLFNVFQQGEYNIHPTICKSSSTLDHNSHIQKSQNYSEETEIKGEIATGNGVISPKALTFLGTYEGYDFWESTPLTPSEARSSCESMGEGFHLATFEKKSHFDFVLSQGASDWSWTGHTGILTRDVFKWWNGSPIPTDIPINFIDPNCILVARISGSLTAQAEYNYGYRSICRGPVSSTPII